MLIISVSNPYYDKTYKSKISEEQFLEYMQTQDINNVSIPIRVREDGGIEKTVLLNPRRFSSVEVWEENE